MDASSKLIYTPTRETRRFLTNQVRDFIFLIKHKQESCFGIRALKLSYALLRIDVDFNFLSNETDNDNNKQTNKKLTLNKVKLKQIQGISPLMSSAYPHTANKQDRLLILKNIYTDGQNKPFNLPYI